MSAETQQYGLWLDCEFTGLNVAEDALLEVGVVVTDGLFNVVDTYEAVIAQDVDEVERLMAQNEWWKQRPEHQQTMVNAIKVSSKDVLTVDQDLTQLAGEYFSEPAVPIGNSPATDHLFVAKHLPTFKQQLHAYRTIDVSSFKELAKRYGGIEEFKKTEQHRVTADIYESIEELRYLLGKMAVIRYH